ncbi:MAG: serine--tRNA ligase [Proteobacteria bacterium]|nr:serine--tRNA ligase [Pseudomonadota bacterium]
MLDRKFILENMALMKANIANRGMAVDVERFAALEQQRRDMQKQLETMRAEANALAKNNALSVDERRTRGGELKKMEAELSARIAPLEADIESIYVAIPNLIYAGSPLGGEDASKDIARGKQPLPKFDFKPADHITLMENLQMLDLVAGAKVAGSGFYYFTNMGALLELALTRFALDHVMKSGFKPVIPPDLARDSLMQGAGFVPRGNESNTYHLEDSDLNLTATSEITLVGRYADEVVDLTKGPLKVAGISHCFRSERAHGSATRGIYRVHQFTKTEMVVVCLPEQAEALHLEMRRLEQEIFDALEIPYRVLEIATGDLGAAAFRKFDLEAWMPMRGGKGDWGEITSTSNCTDFQARRLNIKYRDNSGKLQFAYTLNGTALSVCRAMIALVENHQQADGSVRIPLVLQPYLSGMTHIRKE